MHVGVADLVTETRDTAVFGGRERSDGVRNEGQTAGPQARRGGE